jgi:hypothetical protein
MQILCHAWGWQRIKSLEKDPREYMKYRDEPITSSLGLENLDSVELSHIYAAGQNGCLLRLYWTCCGHLMVLQLAVIHTRWLLGFDQC